MVVVEKVHTAQEAASPVFWPRTTVKPADVAAALKPPPVNEMAGRPLYPVPPAVTVMAVTIPPEIVAVAVAPDPDPPVRVTDGAVAYPAPVFDDPVVTLATKSALACATFLPAGQAEQVELPAAEYFPLSQA